MRRREFLSVGAAGMIGAAACTSSPAAQPPGAAPAAGKEMSGQRIGIKFIGLIAFFSAPTSVDIVAVQPSTIVIPGTSPPVKIKHHTTNLLIATGNLTDPSVGEGVDGTEWRLKTLTRDFRRWVLTGGQQIEITNLKGPDPEQFVYGAVPLARLNPQQSYKNWATKTALIGARLRLEKGVLRDGVPRHYPLCSCESLNWVFSEGKFEDAIQNGQIPRRLTDTVDAMLDCSAPAAFKVGGTTIQTKGDLVEAYIVNEAKFTVNDHEFKNWKDLHHVVAGYWFFDTLPGSKPIPKTDGSTGADGDPVFCPPMWFSE